MDFATRSKEGGESNEEALVERLRQFLENSNLSFYKIAARIGTSGGTLSMWLAGKARPRAEELAGIEKFLKREPHGCV
jgi:DNA transposition AAA+ family ATPase